MIPHLLITMWALSTSTLLVPTLILYPPTILLLIISTSHNKTRTRSRCCLQVPSILGTIPYSIIYQHSFSIDLYGTIFVTRNTSTLVHPQSASHDSGIFMRMFAVTCVDVPQLYCLLFRVCIPMGGQIKWWWRLCRECRL